MGNTDLMFLISVQCEVQAEIWSDNSHPLPSLIGSISTGLKMPLNVKKSVFQQEFLIELSVIHLHF